MKKYVVIEEFTDAQDRKYKYVAGDQFPRDGYKASDARIEELLGDKNRRHRPMIEAVEVADEPQEETINNVATTEDPKEATPEAKEDALTAQTGERPPKTPKAKKNAKKG